MLFNKKKGDKQTSPASAPAPVGGADPVESAAPPDAPVPASAPAPAEPVSPRSSNQGMTQAGLKASFSGMPSAGSAEHVAAMEASTGKRAKTSVLLDLILPMFLAGALGAGFVFTGKAVKDRVGVYGLSKDQQDLVVKDPSIASEAVMVEVAKMDPLKQMELGETAAALDAAKALVKAKPDDVRALLCAARVLVEAGNKADKDAGLADAQKAYDLAKYSRYVRLMYARILVRLHKDEEAIPVYEKIISLWPDKPWSVPHKELAALFMKTNSADQAVAELQALLKVAPDDPGTQRELGLAMAQAGNQQEGFEQFQKGFTREQDVLGYPYAVKDYVEAHAGIVATALADAQKNLAKNPDDIHAMLTVARLYIASNKYKEARELLDKACKKRELDPEVHELLSEVMVLQNQATSAFDEFRTAVSNLHLKD